MGGEGGAAGEDGTQTGGSGGKSPGTGGAAATGGITGTGGAVSTGGAEQTGGAGAAVDAGSGGQADASMSGGSADAGPVGPSPAGQGPNAEGTIVFSRDFEDGSMAGLSRSPNSLPVDRIQITDDPTKQRGKVMRIVYQAGDNFRTSGGTEPRSWLSSADGYQITVGTKISVAWGMLWPELETNAFFAQIIGPGPVFELRFLADGRFDILCNKCGRNSYHMVPRQANRWLDFRVDMDWRNGGLVQFYVDGQMVYQTTLAGADASCHWDGGIYWATDAPSRPTRTVYISNLSIGVRE
jgi:hypothetical protein